jgi:2-oxoglutarate ferredoxin oxidoreductase subunit beta
VIDDRGAKIVEIAEVGHQALHIHNAKDPNPSVAFALSRLSHGPHGPTPLGIFRNVSVEDYGQAMEQQIVEAQSLKGPGSLSDLVRSRGTWHVG